MKDSQRVGPSVRFTVKLFLLQPIIDLGRFLLSSALSEPFLPLLFILDLIPAESREKAAYELATRRDIATDDQLTALLSRMCSWLLLLPLSNLGPAIVTWVDAIVDQLAGEWHGQRNTQRHG